MLTENVMEAKIKLNLYIRYETIYRYTCHSPIWKTLGALIVIVINPDSARGAIPAPRLGGKHVCAIYCKLQSQL